MRKLHYTAWGEFAAPEASVASGVPTGGELDVETRLYHFGARNYDATRGQFLQPDPLIQDVYDPQALNPYNA